MKKKFEKSRHIYSPSTIYPLRNNLLTLYSSKVTALYKNNILRATTPPRYPIEILPKPPRSNSSLSSFKRPAQFLSFRCRAR